MPSSQHRRLTRAGVSDGRASPATEHAHDHDRIDRLEALVEAQQQALEEHRRTLEVQFKRIAAIQAQLDLLSPFQRR